MAKRKAPVQQPIRVRGVRTHNLKNVSLDLPPGKMTTVTGVSGSGKSSLAFDTLYAEGQRRYVESLSTYARQFIARMPRPEVDSIDHIPPAIALEQKNSVKNARSTIGTATEINDYLRVLFARAGRIICPQTELEVRRDTPDGVVRMLLESMDQARVYIIAPITLKKKSMMKGTLAELLRQGYTRIFHGGEMQEIDDREFQQPDGMEIYAVVDRLAVKSDDRSRLAEAVEAAFHMAEGRCIVRTREGVQREFSEELRCADCPGDCGWRFREPSPQLLNFSSPLGACPTCQGFGRVTGLDWGKIIPDPSKSLNGNAVAPWTGDVGQESLHDLQILSQDLGVRMNVPWRDLTDRERTIVRDGRGEWYGIRGWFDWLMGNRYKVQARIMIARYRGYTECEDCGGTRLVEEALNVRLAGKNIGQLCDMPVDDLAQWFDSVQLDPESAAIAERPLAEIRSRLHYLREVGLGYLTLSRQTRTLSGGESQRINLSTSLGSALTETLYVLDEPTVGLHPRDTDRLIGILHRLRDLGNTILVVEHDPDVMRASDFLVDIGPKAGEGGGEIVWSGAPDDLDSAPDVSKTAQYLREEETGLAERTRPGHGVTRFGRRQPSAWITVRGASENNLRHIDARFPLGVMCCITGVSGSGKSTLIHQCLYENYRREILREAAADPGAILGLEGLDKVDGIVMIDQSPLGRSTRSNPATYLKAYDHIRALLAGSPEAKASGILPRDFSFNVQGGRCETCEGQGYQTIDMHFLADVRVLCEECEGQRFQDRILNYRWDGMNVNDILELSINEALEKFAGQKKILNGLQPMARVGLGYLRLGQSTATLSGGEAQRLKLAGHLAEADKSGNLLLLFDEPTTGLHPEDVNTLLAVFEELIEKGFSLIIIEHNLQLIRAADFLIDMGPDGGAGGGEIVAEGAPEEVAANERSVTGRFLLTPVRG